MASFANVAALDTDDSLVLIDTSSFLHTECPRAALRTAIAALALPHLKPARRRAGP